MKWKSNVRLPALNQENLVAHWFQYGLGLDFVPIKITDDEDEPVGTIAYKAFESEFMGRTWLAAYDIRGCYLGYDVLRRLKTFDGLGPWTGGTRWP